ncbi:MAG: hypothetical protein ABJC62_09930 [Frankiaceae bacterium]|jgi:hypothetical protein
MMPLSLPFAIAEIAYRQERVSADFAQVTAGRAPRQRRIRGWLGRVIVGDYRTGQAGAAAAG